MSCLGSNVNVLTQSKIKVCKKEYLLTMYRVINLKRRGCIAYTFNTLFTLYFNLDIFISSSRIL